MRRLVYHQDQSWSIHIFRSSFLSDSPDHIADEKSVWRPFLGAEEILPLGEISLPHNMSLRVGVKKERSEKTLAKEKKAQSTLARQARKREEKTQKDELAVHRDHRCPIPNCIRELQGIGQLSYHVKWAPYYCQESGSMFRASKVLSVIVVVVITIIIIFVITIVIVITIIIIIIVVAIIIIIIVIIIVIINIAIIIVVVIGEA